MRNVRSHGATCDKLPLMGSIMKAFFPDQPIWTMAFAAATLVLAVLAMTRVKVPGEAD